MTRTFLAPRPWPESPTAGSSSTHDLIDNPLAAAQFMADWAQYVALADGPLPGSVLTDPQPTCHGYVFTARLVRGRHVAHDAIDRAALIAARLGLRPFELVIARHPHIKAASVCLVQVICHASINA